MSLWPFLLYHMPWDRGQTPIPAKIIISRIRGCVLIYFMYINTPCANPMHPTWTFPISLYILIWHIASFLSLDLFSINLYPLILLTTCHIKSASAYNHLFNKLGFRGPTGGQGTRTAMPFGHPAPSQSSLRLAIIKSNSTLRRLAAYEKQDSPTQLLVATTLRWCT